MFLFHELLSHAELLQRKSTSSQGDGAGADSRRAPRRQRCGQVTLYPVMPKRITSVEGEQDEVRIAAALSNVSSTGVGLVHSEELSDGMEFDIRWSVGGQDAIVRLQVVHCRPMSAGVYRTGARLLSGILPEEPELTIIPQPVEAVIEAEASPVDQSMASVHEIEALRQQMDALHLEMLQIDSQMTEEAESDSSNGLMPGVLRFEPVPYQAPLDDVKPPAGTFKVSSAFGFDKTEKLEGVTTCGFERSIEMRRDGNRLYLYIHSPGKKNGWGIFIDPNEFEAAFNRVQESAKHPFVTTLAA